MQFRTIVLLLFGSGWDLFSYRREFAPGFFRFLNLSISVDVDQSAFPIGDGDHDMVALDFRKWQRIFKGFSFVVLALLLAILSLPLGL
jgi:hypothetical protein